MRRPSTLRFGNLRLKGWSVAGVETWFRVQPPGIAFDAGRGSMRLAGVSDLFLSHGHLDHALGVPYVLSQRTLHQSQHTRVLCPAATAPALERLIEAAAALENASYDYQLVGLEPGERVAVGKDLSVTAFATDHVVPSLGYHLLRTKHRLAEAYRGLEGPEIARRRAAGEPVVEAVETTVFTYCGDTGPAIFEHEPEVFRSEVLAVECTFLGPEKRDSGALYKHIHLDDLVAHADRFDNQAIVLHHLSRRHRIGDLRAEIDRRLPAGLAERIHLLGEEKETET